MVIMGIDPGLATVGFGIVEYSKNSFSALEYGAVLTPAGKKTELRLEEIYENIDELIKYARPDAVSIEKLYFNTNEKTAVNPIWLQKINGAGICFLRARGRMMRIPVNNQTIRIHPNALVAYESTLNLEFIDVSSKDDFLSISGEGKVWLQSSW